MKIGHWEFHPPNSDAKTSNPPIFLAPMAGITDRPFRQACRNWGAAMVYSEMVTSKAELFHTLKTQTRLNHDGETGPIAVQILGTQPEVMAQAAIYNIQQGADIIDINMGCPAKKVCNTLAGSALLRDELLVEKILKTVVKASNVPVTLKIRTGWDKKHKNALKIAQIAQDCGIQALTIHGRTRECKYQANAEYDIIKEVKQQVSIPIIANGDINSAKKAKEVLEHTQADALMIGRAAVSSPWLFADINQFLQTGQAYNEPNFSDKGKYLFDLLIQLYQFYGEAHGVRIARKHLAAITKPLPKGMQFWQEINQVKDAQQQYSIAKKYFQSIE